MAYGRCQLLDPSPTGRVYDWQVNFSEEDDFGATRGVTAMTTTGGKIILQQGEEEPTVWRITGTILHRHQNLVFHDFFRRGKFQTLIFTDFEGHQYEVLFTAYRPKRERVALNPRDPTIPLHIYRYTMELTVVRAITGPLAPNWNPA